MNELDFSTLNIPPWVFVGAAVLLVAGLLLIVKRVVLVRLGRVTSRTTYHFDSIFVAAINAPLNLVILSFSFVLFEHLLTVFSDTDFNLEKFNKSAVPLTLIIALIVFVDRMSIGALRSYAQRSEGLRSSQSIIIGVARAFILGIGVLVILGTLGISITPIIASLGIGSLAVALALQPTLENFFSGVQLVVDKPIRVGDYIELDSGEQGFVEKIGWRSTWIKMLPNNTVIMPNSLLSQSKIINYFYPSKELSVPVDVGVHYSSDLEEVERITLEVAREILKTHHYGVPEYETFVVYHTFDSSSINFTVMLRAREYFHRFFIKSAFIKALHRRYAEEGIVIPYPIRAINTDQESPLFKRQSVDAPE